MARDHEIDLQRYIDGMLADSKRVHFERRLDREPELRAQFERLRAATETLAGLEPRRLSPAVIARIVSARQAASHRQSAGGAARRRMAAVAAAVVLAATAGFFVGRLSGGVDAHVDPSPGGSLRSGLISGIPRDPVADAALRTPADTDAPSFLLLLHGPPPERLVHLSEEMHSWRETATSEWASALKANGRLVASGDVSAGATGLEQGETEGDVEVADPTPWYTESWMAPTKFFVLRANDLEEASRLAGVLPHTSLGGRISLRQIVPSSLPW